MDNLGEVLARLDTLITDLKGGLMRTCVVCSKRFISKNKPCEVVSVVCGTRCQIIQTRRSYEELKKVYNYRREAAKQERLYG